MVTSYTRSPSRGFGLSRVWRMLMQRELDRLTFCCSQKNTNNPFPHESIWKPKVWIHKDKRASVVVFSSDQR